MVDLLVRLGAAQAAMWLLLAVQVLQVVVVVVAQVVHPLAVVVQLPMVFL